ncbi:MAG: glycosyltransferase family 4 protein [Candidatus Pacebacteria bacterium]|nr:glycosyltransferase family 4 protein [Candidatus Paceibacterota bacterium]
MKKKNILFLITKSNFGGAQRYVFDLASSLPKEEYAVTVAFGGQGVLQDKLREVDIQTVSINGLDRDISLFKDFAVFKNVYSLLKETRPNIIHLNSSKISGIGALMGRITKVPRIIFTAHGWAFNEERPIWQKVLLWFFSWLTVLLSHQTIAVSHQIKDQIGRGPLTKRKTVVIHNGVKQAGVFTSEEAREIILENNPNMRESLPKDAFWVGTVSELHTTKGLLYAIRALQQIRKTHPKVIFVVIGEGEERKNLQKSVQDAGLSDCVFFLGFIDTAAQYLRAFDIFTLTSISEALSYTILEAGLSERTVVASDVGGIPEIITSRDNGILTPARDSQSIAEAVLSLIDNPGLRQRYGEALKEKVVADFSLEQMLRKTVRIYES